jgi:hypothetical protein
MPIHDPDGNTKALQGNVVGDQYFQGRGNTKFVTLRDTAVVVDEGYVLIDLSNSAGYPHTETGRIRLYSLTVTAELESDATGKGRLYIGVVTELDATNGSVDWFLVIDFQTFENADDDSTRYVEQFTWPNGLDLEVDVSGETCDNLLTATKDSGTTTWQTDVTLTSPLTGGSAPGQGDVVVFWDETADGASLDFCILAEYITQAAT